MRESFSEYKKTLESNLINIPFLYAGDVINSSNYSYSEVRNIPLTSPSFIINCLIDIYDKSFKLMKSRSKDVILPAEIFFDTNTLNKNILYTLKELDIEHGYIFTSGKNSMFFGNINTPSNRPFPHYFYESKSFGNNIDILTSPLVDENESETVLFVSDKPIQSLVYSIQNMDYKITPDDNNTGKEPHLMKWTHQIEYPLYNCDYLSYKIIIKNVSEIRNQKINELLNDN